MAEDRRDLPLRLGPLLLGRCHDGLGAGLGRLYETWQEDTGEPVLLLRPDTGVNWSPAGPLRLQVYFNPDVSTVTVKVEEALAPPDLSDVANLFVMTTASVTRVEDDARGRAHVDSRPRPGSRTSPPLPTRRPHVGRALAGVALAAFVSGVWLYQEREPDCSKLLWAERGTEKLSTYPAWTLGDS